MRRNEFNYYYQKLTSENGKQYFEEELQYNIEWFFLSLTENQNKKITDLLIKWEYPIEHFGATATYIRFPNGIKLLIHE